MVSIVVLLYEHHLIFDRQPSQKSFRTKRILAKAGRQNR